MTCDVLNFFNIWTSQVIIIYDRIKIMKAAYQKIFVILIITALCLSIFLLGLEIANAKRIVWGVKTAGLDLGGLKFRQAKDILEKQLLLQQKRGLTFVYQNQNWPTKLEDLGVKIATDQTLKKAFQIGRQKNIFLGLSQQIQALFGQYNLTLDFQIDQSKLETFVANEFSRLENPAQNARFVYNQTKNDFEIILGQEGLVIDKDQFQNNIKERISFLSEEPIALILIKEKPKITEQEAREKYQLVSKILKTSPYILKVQNKSWFLKKEMLADWLTFEPRGNTLEISLNREKVEDFLISLAPAVNQPAINARLAIGPTDPSLTSTLQNNKVIISAPAQDKIEIKIKESVDLINENVLKNQKEIYLALDSSPPLVSSQTTNQLGLIAFIGQGTSNFSGSPKNRIHNIKIGAAKFNGLLLKPNEEFSFNEILGEVGPQQGYLPALVIKNNKTIPEYGGGLCQVSTTLFRAAVNSGLKITERYAHAFPVAYYNPPGFDATIYPPQPDLRFVNDTDNYVLIQSKVEGNEISFEVFGSSDGRQVKIIGPQILEKKEDGSMKTALTQEVYQSKKLLRKKTFYSNYKSPDLYPIERNPLE